MKLKISRLFHLLFITQFFRKISDLYFGNSYIRVVNYHSTPKSQIATFEQHLQYYQKHYTTVSYQDLDSFFKTGKWEKNKPGLIISFDDGQRTNFDFAYPLLEKYGFTGWFFIPTGFIDIPVSQQRKFMVDNMFTKNHSYSDGRYAMTWEELMELDKKDHIIGSHTISHHEVSVADNLNTLEREIKESKQILESKMKRKIPTFCWVRGRLTSYSHNAAKVIKAAGYKYSFMTNTYPILDNSAPLQIQRTNIETRNPLHLVKFQLCGLMDLHYYKKRRKVVLMTRLS